LCHEFSRHPAPADKACPPSARVNLKDNGSLEIRRQLPDGARSHTDGSDGDSILFVL